MLTYSPETIILFAGLLLIATVFAGTLSNRFGIPALIGFLSLGMIAGSDGPLGIAFDNHELAQTIGILCLIFILFSGGLDTDLRTVRNFIPPALVLATAGVVTSACIVAVGAAVFLNFSLLEGFLLGSIISSTDAAAVFAISRAQKTPLRTDVVRLAELESGSNDPMAIFLVGAALVVMLQSGSSPWSLAPAFVLEMIVGATVGVAIGFGFVVVLRRARLRVGGLALVVSIAAALLAYGSAGVSHGNGFLAAYVSGIIAGSHEFTGKKNVLMFQDGVAWLAQVVMFLSLGLLVFPSQLPSVIVPGLAITIVLMVIARPLSVFLCLAPFRQFDWKFKVFVSWAGLRGAVPIVLATFPVVAGLPQSQMIFNVVFFVVVVSSLIQGTTLGLLGRRLGLGQPLGEAEAGQKASVSVHQGG